MFEYWIAPLDTAAEIPDFERLAAHQLGKNIHIYQTDIADELAIDTPTVSPLLHQTQIALIGIGAASANAVRSALYQLSCPFTKLKILDLGNARRMETNFLTPILTELLAAGICPVLIGESAAHTLSQWQAYPTGAQQAPINIALIDNCIRYTRQLQAEDFYLHQILEARNRLFHCSVLGYQAHFTAPEAVHLFEDRHFEHLRLGKVRAAMETCEPVLRDADAVSVHLAALRYAEAAAQESASPSGLTTEEACQLTRYAGMSDKLTSIGFYGYLHHRDRDQQSAQTVAQLIWYFLDGFYHRKNDYPSAAAKNHLVEYIVDVKDLDTRITFWKSNKSGRWWMQIPLKIRKKLERHRLVPCSYTDYLEATQGELPESLWVAYRRFG